MRSIEQRAKAAAEKWYNESDDRIGVEKFIVAEFADLADNLGARVSMESVVRHATEWWKKKLEADLAAERERREAAELESERLQRLLLMVCRRCGVTGRQSDAALPCKSNLDHQWEPPCNSIPRLQADLAAARQECERLQSELDKLWARSTQRAERAEADAAVMREAIANVRKHCIAMRKKKDESPQGSPEFWAGGFAYEILDLIGWCQSPDAGKALLEELERLRANNCNVTAEQFGGIRQTVKEILNEGVLKEFARLRDRLAKLEAVVAQFERQMNTSRPEEQYQESYETLAEYKAWKLAVLGEK